MILPRGDRFGVKFYVGKTAGRQPRYVWLGTFATREAAAAAELAAGDARAERAADLDLWSLVRKREWDCRVCGAPAEHLHHSVPTHVSPAGVADVDGNGLPLCETCHHGWHRRTVVIWQETLSLEELAAAILYGGPCWVAGNYPQRSHSRCGAPDGCRCTIECEWPRWQRIGLTDTPCCRACAPLPYPASADAA